MVSCCSQGMKLNEWRDPDDDEAEQPRACACADKFFMPARIFLQDVAAKPRALNPKP